MGRTIGDEQYSYDTLPSIFEVNIKDLPVYSGPLLNEDMIPKDSNYAHTDPSGSAMVFKSGILQEFEPGFALAIMVHEFTAHRFDRVWERDKKALRLNDENKDITILTQMEEATVGMQRVLMHSST